MLNSTALEQDDQAGFTLLDVVVAMGLFGVFSIMVMGFEAPRV